MKLIVGLGNPGRLYTGSRHNIGFSVVQALAKEHKAPLKNDRNTRSLTAKARIAKQEVILATPLTYMNLSGNAVGALVKKYKTGLEGLLVICDDLDLELGRLRIRPGGSSAGHNGIQSIIDALGSKNFSRLRIGIGKDKRVDAARYVLSRFNRQEREKLKEVIFEATACCQMWAGEGVAQAMNIFNRRSA